MSINIWTDSMQHAALLGKPVLFTNWLIQRDIIPDGWYCYDLRGTHKSPSTRTTLVDHAADYHAGTVLSPIPLKHEGMVKYKALLNPRFQKGEWVQWMQEMPPGSPPELLKAAETFSNLKLGFRGDLKFQQNPEVIEVAPLVEAAQTQFLDISFLM